LTALYHILARVARGCEFSAGCESPLELRAVRSSLRRGCEGDGSEDGIVRMNAGQPCR
jgi:hypothetical protein